MRLGLSRADGIHRARTNRDRREPRRSTDALLAARSRCIDAELQKRPAKLVAFVHAETTTGACQPIAPMVGAAEPQYQALLRMRDSSGQLHTAAELVPEATRAGLIGAIDQ